MSVERLVEGTAYVVATDRGRLDSIIWSNGGGSPQTYRLRRGDVITYLGRRDGWGSDSVPEDRFRTDTGESGAYSPSTWGMTNLETLDPLGEWAHWSEADDAWCVHPSDPDEPARLFEFEALDPGILIRDKG